MGLFFFETFTLLSLAGFLIYFGSLTYELWTKPDESWQKARRTVAHRRVLVRRLGLGFLPIDILGFENSRERYLRFSKVTFLLFDVIYAAFLVAFALLFFGR